jgi:flagellar protein FliJ
MKKFSFRLERILQYKLQIEDQKRRELTARLDELEAQKTILLQLTIKKDECQRQYSSLFKGAIDVDKLKNTRRFLDKLQHDQINQTKKIVECEKKVEKAKANLLEAMRDRKKYDNLKERKLQAYGKEINRQEQKALDEFGGQATRRKRQTAIDTA